MSQKARNVGDVTVFINRGSTMERVVLESLQDFRDVQRLLNDASHSARAAVLKAQNTQHYGEGSPFQVVSAAAAQPTAAQAAPTAAAPDPIDQIRKLAELRDAGILSPQEFDAKKVEILSRM